MLHILNIILFLLSMLYLWRPLTFKFFGVVFYYYSLNWLMDMIIKRAKEIPEMYVQWDNVPYHYKGIFRLFILYGVIMIVIKIFVKGLLS